MTQTTSSLPDQPITGFSIARGLGQLLLRLPAVLRGARILALHDKDRALSIGALLEQTARRYPDQPALLCHGFSWSYRELNARVNRYAHTLAGLSVAQGEVVGVLIENRPHLLAVIAALAKLGAIASVYNTSQRGAALAHSMRLKQPTHFMVGAELLAPFEDVRESLAPESESTFWFVPDEGGGACPAGYRDLDLASAGAPADNPASTGAVRLRDPCFYIFTSGTTGLPKASIMSHFRWFKAVGAFGHMTLALKPGEILYVPLPFYHNTALTVGWACALSRGAGLAIRRKFSASEFWSDIRRFQAVACVYIGEMCRYLCNQPERPDDRDHPLRKMIGNGLRPDIWMEFKQRFGVREIYELYGASEGNIAFVNLLNQDCTVGLCPAPYALVECEIETGAPIRDAAGRLRRVPEGEPGLLVGEVSERFPFDGYTDPNANASKLLRDAFAPGDCWFNTGDLMRSLGYKHAQFVDRLGDTYRWHGENVSTTEVEAVAHGFPGVLECAVYGVAIPRTEGRAGMICLAVADPAAFDLDGLAEHLLAGLPAYAVPIFLRLRSQLAVTGTFKHIKAQLKAEAYDPERVSDPLYVRAPNGRRFEPLDAEYYARLMAGEFRY